MGRPRYFKATQGGNDDAGLFPEYSEGETRRAWENYVTGQPETGEVRSEIVQSWQRSMNLGVDATRLQSRKIERDEELRKLRRRNASLRQAARAAFARLEPHLAGAQVILILTDNNGVIIDAIGDHDVLDAGQNIHLEIGGVWNEDVIGTNGIGTALKTGKPTYVHAAEHFCQGVQAWTCAGVPIFDPFDRSVIGVVDLSGPPDIFRRHNIALVVAAAREIEIALAEQQREERTRLLETFLNSDASRPDTSVLLLDKVGRIMFRRGLDDRLHLPRPDFAVGHQLLPLSANMTEGDIRAALPRDIETDGITRLEFDGSLRGAALSLKRSTAIRPQDTVAVRIKPRANVDEDEIVIVGNAPKMLEAIELAERAASAGVTVLIQGETGVGKELFARLVHNRIDRRNAPYVTVNCAAISKELIGAELFGHVEGAFTGALRGGKPGKFEQADGGVLCLDEIGDMPVELQPYLLRALEQRAVYRIGDDQRRPVNVQLVAMTNRNLRSDVEQGRFRRDLFYRIGIVAIDVPPLRQRSGDVALLIDHFNGVFSDRFSRPRLVFAPAVMDRLKEYRWPGNVRELRNLVERLYLLKSGPEVGLNDLPPEIIEPADGLGFSHYVDVEEAPINLENMEAMTIRRAIQAEKGNLTRVAEQLGISRPTLYRKIKQYGIPRD
ncbi:Transcriptional regulator of acetoin/glycerol metabolism [Mameliella alba]|uniref:sigma-54-dependent Fis family transcriptional regulator n=1 Tax=Mameliella alba TaxID=561184 RepID=UPI0008863176|nr:sigma-54-dependent Fis family transcriptional regulator [Mameliella alba]OWV46100.1 sigma-54-dependent Fis family transcriptional regulator [Mameliella alba]PTR37059.1 transcriptional regulator of acetoin/glycerol metabolism [Mameliella alba]GGF76503.1 sigma-54-dependent Fis family transcriptional regulator [Mameliella alba]SDD83587.1 Transcriptional regulator of acetoin/glycerol metabolism [Mameliella alba]